MASFMQFAAAVTVPMACASAVDAGWNQYIGGNECQYKLVDEQVNWFDAVRHCHDYENRSELALVQSEEEAQFTGALGSEGLPRWIFGYFDDSGWNIDYGALNLWHGGPPDDPNTSVKHCVVQGGSDDDEQHRLSAESCSAKRHFVCKVCPSKEASEMVVGRQIVPIHIRQKRRGAPTSTTTHAPTAGSTTTTTDAPVTGGIEGGLDKVLGESLGSSVSTDSSAFTLTVGAVVAVVLSSVVVFVTMAHRRRKNRATINGRNGEGLIGEILPSFLAIADCDAVVIDEMWDDSNME
jgi:hypothetical protein